MIRKADACLYGKHRQQEEDGSGFSYHTCYHMHLKQKKKIQKKDTICQGSHESCDMNLVL